MNSDNSNTQKSYITDDPVRAKKDDELERYTFAERVVKTIVTRKDPSSLVVGIYGAWGEGKSTVLNFINNVFDEEHKDSIHCIRFNPWYFSNEEQLLTSFFELLASELDGGILSNKERIGVWLKDYLAALIPPKALKVSAPFKLLTVDPGYVLNSWGEKLSEVSLDKRKEDLDKFLENEKKKIVVMIDDVDRLDKDEIQTVLKLVKLLANFKHTAYILAFDEEMVASAIGGKYGGDKESGKGFLEKIVQVPIHLPKVSRDSLERFCFQEVKQTIESLDLNLNDDEWLRFTENFESGLRLRVQTIRMVKRYINALVFALPLVRDEVNIVDFLLLEGMRIFYPQLYSDLRDNPSDYLKDHLKEAGFGSDPKFKEGLVDILNKKLNEFANDEIAAKQLLICLFPNICSLYSYSKGTSWDSLSAREITREGKLIVKKRVCSEEYFLRFFEYKVPDGDISDLEIDDFIERVGISDSKSSVIMANFVNQGKAFTFLLKISNRLKDLAPTIAQEIALSLAKLGLTPMLAIHQKPIRFIHAHSLPCEFQRLIYDLIETTTDLGERFTFLQKVIVEAELLPFATNFFKDISKYNILSDEEKWISSEQTQKLGKIIADRILQHFDEKSIFDCDKVLHLLIHILFHFGVKEENHKFFKRQINGNSGNAILLIISVSELPLIEYNDICQLVNIDFLYNEFNKINDLSQYKSLEQSHVRNNFLAWYKQNEHHNPDQID